MTDYSFESLNDKEFEIFSADLISAHLKVSVERFKPGRDQGVDGRFYSAGNEVIIQCKHWPKSGVNALISKLKNHEIKSVRALKPKRYIFVTSLELSRLNKKEIANIFKGFIIAENDIFSREDLNDILSKHPEIEQRHYKLWLSSTNVLQIILNSGIIGRSKHTLATIKKKIPIYVETKNHVNAIERLENLHTVIITGSPGAGKTTLADQLCYHYTAKQFEFVFIQDAVEEAEAVYNEKKKQIFYFDDFLGRNHLMALEHNQDSKIVHFINRVKDDTKKRFVLTSRTNIINQGKHLSDLFKIEKIDQNEFELKIHSLNLLDKAKILYNHIWFGNLTESFIDEIYKDKRYLKIIEHRNFNPRLISFITDPERFVEIDAANYWNYLHENLEDPKEVWRTVIEIQLDKECRDVVISLVLNYKHLSERELKRIIQNLMKNIPSFDNSRSIDSILKILVGALVNRKIENKEASYSLFDPSIGDFVISNYLNNLEYIASIIFSLDTIDSINYLGQLEFARQLSRSNSISIHKLIYEKKNSERSLKLNSQFDVKLLKKIVVSGNYPVDFKESFHEILFEYIQGRNLLRYDQMQLFHFSINADLFDNTSIGLISRVKSSLETRDFTEEELKGIEAFIQEINPEDNSVFECYRSMVIEFVSDNLNDLIINEEIYRDLFETVGDDYGYDLEFRDDALDKYIEEKLYEFKMFCNQGDIEKIAAFCDSDSLYEYNIEMDSNIHEDDMYRGGSSPESGESDTDQIDDLFDRS